MVGWSGLLLWCATGDLRSRLGFNFGGGMRPVAVIPRVVTLLDERGAATGAGGKVNAEAAAVGEVAPCWCSHASPAQPQPQRPQPELLGASHEQQATEAALQQLPIAARVALELPKGSYATVCIRELTKMDPCEFSG